MALILLIISSCCLSIFAKTEVVTTPIRAAIWMFDKNQIDNVPRTEYRSRSMEVSDLVNLATIHSDGASKVIILKSSGSQRILSNEVIISSINKSPSALLMPHIYYSESTKESAHDCLSKSSRFANSEDISLSDLLLHVNGDKASDSKTFTTHVSDNSEDRALLEKIQQVSSNFVFIAIDEPVVVTSSVNMNRGEYSRILEAAGEVFPSSSIYYKPEGSEYSIYYADTYLYITPDIFTGLMTMIFFAFTVYIGMNCLGDIQTPSSFALVKPPVGREA